jgi:hypothetical protein
VTRSAGVATWDNEETHRRCEDGRRSSVTSI